MWEIQNNRPLEEPGDTTLCGEEMLRQNNERSLKGGVTPQSDTGGRESYRRTSQDREQVGGAGRRGCTDAHRMGGPSAPSRADPPPPGHTTAGRAHMSLYRSSEIMFAVLVTCAQVFQK